MPAEGSAADSPLVRSRRQLVLASRWHASLAHPIYSAVAGEEPGHVAWTHDGWFDAPEGACSNIHAVRRSEVDTTPAAVDRFYNSDIIRQRIERLRAEEEVAK